MNRTHEHTAWTRFVYLLIPCALTLGLALLAGCGGGGGGGGGGGTPPATLTLTGQVTDPFATTAPVPGAIVALNGTNKTATADGNGNYSLAGVPQSSTVTLTVTDPAYPTNQDKNVSVQTSNVSPQTFNVSYPFSLTPP